MIEVADEERFELSVPLPVRLLSREVVSAAHPFVHFVRGRNYNYS